MITLARTTSEIGSFLAAACAAVAACMLVASQQFPEPPAAPSITPAAAAAVAAESLSQLPPADELLLIPAVHDRAHSPHVGIRMLAPVGLGWG